MFNDIRKNIKSLSRRPTFWVALIAAFTYSSWPLGFWLNPFVAHRYFASQLEAPHEPYNWVFITLDIISGVLMIILGALQHRRANRASLRAAIIAYMLFGAMVVAAALVPNGCSTVVCHIAWTPGYLIHDASSVVSVVLLLVSLILAAIPLMKRRLYRWLLPIVTFIVIGWGITGIGTILTIIHGLPGVWLQYELITICSVTALFNAITIERLSHGHELFSK